MEKIIDKLPLLSVIIPTYNRPQDLENLLGSLEVDMEYIEIIIVDDGSPHPFIFNSLKSRYPSVSFIHKERNEGPGAARNLGAFEAKGEILLFLDSDTKLVSGSIRSVCEFFKENPNIQVCTGWDGSEPINNIFFQKYKALFQTSVAPNYDCKVSFVAGRCFSIRRFAMLEIGGFNTSYRGADVEDYEIGYRLRKRFGVIWFLSKLKVQHNYPSILKQFKLYFHRVILWMDLRSKEGGFDNNLGTTAKDALINILSASMPFVLIISVITDYVLVGIIFLFFAIMINKRFITLCWYERGLIFTIRAVACHSFLAMAICSGVIVFIYKKTITKFFEKFNLFLKK